MADFLSRVIEDLYEALKPVVAHWFRVRVVPAVKAKRDDLRQRRRERKATKALQVDASESTEQDAATPQEAAVVPSQPTITVTSEQFQELFMMWLVREDCPAVALAGHRGCTHRRRRRGHPRMAAGSR
jgi:hypothetical protein